MNWRGVAMIAATGLTLSGCVSAGLQRLDQYQPNLAMAKTTVDGRAFSLSVHPRDNTILVMRGLGAAVGQSFVRTATLGTMNGMEPRPVWRRAAESLTAPLGCAVTDVYTLDNQMTWEATFTCPPGVDLRAKVLAQRDALRRGEAIRP